MKTFTCDHAKIRVTCCLSIAVDMPFNKQLYYSNKGAFTNYVDNILPIIDHLSYLPQRAFNPQKISW